MKYGWVIGSLATVGVLAALATAQPSLNSSHEEKLDYANERHEELAGAVQQQVIQLQDTMQDFSRTNEARGGQTPVFPERLKNEIIAESKALMAEINHVADTAPALSERLYGSEAECSDGVSQYMNTGYQEFENLVDAFAGLDPEGDDAAEAAMMVTMEFSQQLVEIMRFQAVLTDCLLRLPSS